MRRVYSAVAVALLVVALALAGCSDARAGLAGNWYGTVTGSNAVGAVYVSLREGDGSSMPGSVEVCQQNLPKGDAAGTVDNTTLRLTFHTSGAWDLHGGAHGNTLQLTGTQQDDATHTSHPVTLTLQHGSQRDFETLCYQVGGV